MTDSNNNIDINKQKTKSGSINDPKATAKMAAIGDKDTVLIFKAVGMEIFYDCADIKSLLKSLAERDYSLILITEREAQKAGDIFEKQAAMPYPVILTIPDGVNDFGFTKARMMANMEKALGTTPGGFK